MGIRPQPDDVSARSSARARRHASRTEAAGMASDGEPDRRRRRALGRWPLSPLVPLVACPGVRAAICGSGRPARHAARGHHRADPDRHPRVPGRGPAFLHRGHGRDLRRSGAVGPVPAARSGLVHRAPARPQHRAALPGLARDRCAGPGGGPRRRAPTTAATSWNSASTTCSPQRELVGKRFAADASDWRRLAHRAADQVYERLTGEKGYFDTQVAFIDETGPKDRRRKRLALMDQDGANVRLLSQGGELVLTPRFSPTAQEITYPAVHRRAAARVPHELGHRPDARWWAISPA